MWTTAQHGTNPRGAPTRDGDLSAQSACPGGTGCTACHPGRLQAQEKRRPRRSSAETRVDTNLSDVLQSPLLQELACHLLPEKSPLGVSMLFTTRLPPPMLTLMKAQREGGLLDQRNTEQTCSQEAPSV